MRLEGWSIAVGAGLVIGVALMFAGPAILRQSDPEYATRRSPASFARREYQINWTDSPEKKAIKRERIRKKNEFFNIAFPATFYGGLTLIALSLGAGLLIGTGRGPRWMSTPVSGSVSERFVYYDGTKHFGIPDHISEGARFYVRFRTASGQSDEVATSPEVYGLLAPGTVFRGRALGSRLIELHSPLTPPNPDA